MTFQKVLPKCFELSNPTPHWRKGAERGWGGKGRYLRLAFEGRPNLFPRAEEEDLALRDDDWKLPLDFPAEGLKLLPLEKPHGVELDDSLNFAGRDS